MSLIDEYEYLFDGAVGIWDTYTDDSEKKIQFSKIPVSPSA